MNSVFCFDQFELNCRALELRHCGEFVRVDAIVLKLLEALVRSPGEVLSKEALISEIWSGRAVSENALAVAVGRLRRVLDDHGMPRASIVTVHGHGYRFTRPVSSSSRPALESLVGPPGSELVGREHVLLQLLAALSEAQNERGRLVALRGEAGVGKTRIAEIFAQYAVRAGSVVAWGYCRDQEATPPLWPILELLRSVTSQAGAAGTNGAQPALTSTSELGELLTELVTLGEEAQAGRGPELLGSKYQVFDAVARTLAEAAKTAPLVLILDDFHRADQASLELTRYLLANISRTRILLIATSSHAYRDADLESPLSAAFAHRNCIRIAIEPLGPSDVASYLAGCFGAVDHALSQKVYELSEGNPFCMVELARQLRDGSAVNAAELTVPKVARELVSRRLGALSADTHEALTYAAVLGRVFSLPLLAAVMGRHATEVMATLDNACAAQVVETIPYSGMEFRFTHGLLHAALYDGQSPAERRMRHLRVTETLEQRRILAEVPQAALAYHAHAALPRGDLRKAVEYCTEAASTAEQIGEFSDAIRHIQDAREALDLIENESPHERFQLLFRHALLVRAHSPRAFPPLADQLLRQARELGGAPLAAASLHLDPLPGFPRLPLMRNALTDALGALSEDTPSLRPALMARLASSTPLAYDATASYAQIDRALALAQRSPDRADRFSAHIGELFLYGGPAHTARAEAALTALYRLCNETAPTGPAPLAFMDLHLALTALQHGDVAQATRALDRWELRAGAMDCEQRWLLKRMRALMQINLGHASNGQRALLALHSGAHGCDDHSGMAMLCAYDQHVLISPGKLCDSRRVALAPDAYDPPNIWALKLRALEAAGAVEDAHSALLLVPSEGLCKLPCDREFLGTMGALARTALRLEARAYVRAIYECLLPFSECFALNISGYCEGSVSLLLGLLARFMGDMRRAAEHFEEAVVFSQRASFPSSVAEARHEHARCNQKPMQIESKNFSPAVNDQ